jgi:hypothetical protein
MAYSRRTCIIWTKKLSDWLPYREQECVDESSVREQKTVRRSSRRKQEVSDRVSYDLCRREGVITRLDL